MLEVTITPEQVVDLHVKKEIIRRSANMMPKRHWLHCHLCQVHDSGIFEILGWGSLLDFAAWSKIERIQFDADYNFLP